MERLPRRTRLSAGPARRRSRVRPSPWSRLTVLAGAVTLLGIVLPAGVGRAVPQAPPPSLAKLLARAGQLSGQIDSLGQQYDGLKIQLAQARAEAGAAQATARRDEALLTAGQAAVGHLAAFGYMTGGLTPELQLLQTGRPQAFLDRASFLLQLQQESGDRVQAIAAAEAAAQRAQLAAAQQQHRAITLAAAVGAKVAAIQARENVLNSAVFRQAMAIYRQQGSYPAINVPGNSVGVQALRHALTRIGDPYVWGGAGPSVFDCSGLVMWSYAQIGLSLPHFTGDLWNSGEHVPRSQLEPGDLVFFFADISHVGMYVGNGDMVDAPTFGQPVQIQPIFWSAYAGAVRIVA